MRRPGSKRSMMVALATAALVMGSVTPALASQGWNQNQTGWWYEESGGAYVTSGWRLINGAWYYFDASGYMSTGWILESGRWYFADATGAMQTGLVEVNGETYYLNPVSDGTRGAMVTGEATIGGNVLHFNESGACTDTLMVSGTIPQYYANGEKRQKEDHPSGGSSGGGGSHSITSGVSTTVKETNKAVVEAVNDAKEAAIAAGKLGENAPVKDVKIDSATDTSKKTVTVTLNESQKATATIAEVSEPFVDSAKAVIDDPNVTKIEYGGSVFSDKDLAKQALDTAAARQGTLDTIGKSVYTFTVTLTNGETVEYTVRLN